MQLIHNQQQLQDQVDRQQQEQERVTREAAEDRAGREAVEKEVARFATEVAAVSGVEGKQRVGEAGVCAGGAGRWCALHYRA